MNSTRPLYVDEATTFLVSLSPLSLAGTINDLFRAFIDSLSFRADYLSTTLHVSVLTFTTQDVVLLSAAAF